MATCIKCKEKEAAKSKNKQINEFTLCEACYRQERRKNQQLSTYDDIQLLAEEIKEYDFYIDGSEGKATKVTTTTKGIRKSQDKVNINFLTANGLKLLSGGHIRRQMITKTDLFNDLDNNATLFNYASLIIRCANKNNQVVDPKFLDSGVEALKQDGAEVLANQKALKQYLGFKGKNDRTFNETIKTLEKKQVIKIDGAGVVHVNPLYSNYSAIISLHSFILFKDSLKKKLYKEQYREVVADMFFRYIFTSKAKEYIYKGYILAAKRELENYVEYYKNTYGADFANLIEKMFMVNLEQEIKQEEARILGIACEGKSTYKQVMIRLGMLNGKTMEEMIEDDDIDEDILKQIDASIDKTEHRTTTVTDIKTKKTITTIDGREVDIPPAPLKKSPKVNTTKFIIYSPATAAKVNNYVFEEDDTYDFVNKLNNKYKEIV